MNPTFSDFLTPAGIIVAAGVVTAFVELLKGVFPAIDERVSGALLAFIVTGLLYVFTALAVPPASPDGWLTVFLAWLACATSSVGIKSATAHAQKVAS